MINWKKNLAVIWLSQFFSILGFSMVLPFLPFYIQELGVTDTVQLKHWTAVIAAAGPLTLGVFAPIWGAIADRHGRRLMLIRANLGGVTCLALGGLVPSVQWLLAVRLFQGAFTGTVSAAQTLVSVNTPVNRTGMALGLLSSAVFTGTMAGNMLGGILAEAYGYRMVFFFASSILLLATIFVLGVKEDFMPPRRGPSPGRRRKIGIARILAAAPLLILIGFMAFTRQFDLAMFPLFVQDVKGTLKGAALWTGYLHATGGLAALLAGACLGWLADRLPPAKIGKYSALAAGIFMLPHIVAGNLTQLVILRFCLLFAAGGLDPVFQIWLAKATPHKYRGVLFGWALTSKSIGWTLAPLASGTAAAYSGFNAVYILGSTAFIILVPMITVVLKLMKLEKNTAYPRNASGIDTD